MTLTFRRVSRDQIPRNQQNDLNNYGDFSAPQSLGKIRRLWTEKVLTGVERKDNDYVDDCDIYHSDF